MTRWVVVAKEAEIPPGTRRVVDVGDVPIALVNEGGAIHALLNLCPHRGGPVGEGVVSGGVVQCPWHGWQFHVESGRCLTNPGALVRKFPVEMRDGVVRVGLEE